GSRQNVPRLCLPADPQRTVSQGLHPHREPGRRDRGARAPEQAAHRRLLPLEVQGRRGRVLPHGRVHGRMEDLADRSATELARLVASRELSPVEVVEACLARVARCNPAVNAVLPFNHVCGRPRNPWEPRRSAGGSTGGGAAGLATGMIALAEGTDLGGSLRIPASFCGVVGLRPSVGLVPTYPTDWAWDTLQVEGPVARTAEDVALMLQAVAGPSPLSPLAQPTAGRNFVAAAARGLPPGLRVAYCPDVAGIGIDPAIEPVCRRAAVGLGELGVELDEIDLD